MPRPLGFSTCKCGHSSGDHDRSKLILGGCKSCTCQKFVLDSKPLSAPEIAAAGGYPDLSGPSQDVGKVRNIPRTRPIDKDICADPTCGHHANKHVLLEGYCKGDGSKPCACNGFVEPK